jgi:hypothetical protein
MAVTQKSYVDNSSSVKAARKKLEAAKAALSDANKAKAGLPSSAGKDLSNQIDARISQAEKNLDKSLADVTEIETKAKDYFTKNQTTIQEKASAKEKATGESNIASTEAQIARMKQAGLDTTQIEQELASAKAKTNKPTIKDLGSAETQGAPAQTVDDFKGLIKDARRDIQRMPAPERLDLANKLLSINIQVPKSGEFTDALVQGYTQLLGAAQGYYNANKEFPTVDAYLAEQQRQVGIIGTGAGKLPYGQIYDKTAAKAKVNEIVKSVLNREATDKEVSSLSAQIIKAQKDNPYRTVNGRTVGGLDVDQFVKDLVQATPEFAAKKQAKQDLTAQSIQSTALANAIKLSDAQLKTYSDRVKNGEDIKTIEAQIRNTAGLGQPDTIKKMLADGTDLNTIYDPYRRLMATSLGITPDSITLDDPTLRMAIGPDKEMSLYDYKKAIRQDNRWKYSEEANNEVTNMINQVKRDFGFMG